MASSERTLRCGIQVDDATIAALMEEMAELPVDFYPLLHTIGIAVLERDLSLDVRVRPKPKTVRK